MLQVVSAGYVLLALVAAAATGCRSSLDTFNCASDSDCQLEGADGSCEEEKVCSFADSDCDSGRRFGKLGGDNSNQCVLDVSILDAAPVDASPADADLRPLADAMVDATVDAMPDADLSPGCMSLQEALTCPSAACPNSLDDTCCVYQALTGTPDCHDICNGAGLNCEDGFESNGECAPGNKKPCGNNAASSICYCL